jgi:hypothetical protein
MVKDLSFSSESGNGRDGDPEGDTVDGWMLYGIGDGSTFEIGASSPDPS